jgi:hypothetical protein
MMSEPKDLVYKEAIATGLRLRAEHLLMRLKHSQENCWCELAIGNPMYKDHTKLCKEIRAYFEATK